MTDRPRPQAMRLTEAAATRIRELSAASGKEIEDRVRGILARYTVKYSLNIT